MLSLLYGPTLTLLLYIYPNPLNVKPWTLDDNDMSMPAHQFDKYPTLKREVSGGRGCVLGEEGLAGGIWELCTSHSE